MGYKVDKLRLSKFYRYICQRYNFLRLVSGQSDSRQDSEVSIETIFVSVFLCLLLRWGSFRRIHRELTRRQLQKFIPKKEPLTCCQNTIGYGLEHIDTEIQEEQLASVVKKLHRSINWDIPLRGFKIIERKQTKKGVIENTLFCVTTLPKFLASANVIRQIVHAQWGIENNGFKDLKDNWFMEHNFHHHPNATFAVLLILFLAYNLFYAYLLRQMKTYMIYNLTQKEVIEEFLYSYIQQKRKVPFRLYSGP